MITAAFSLSGDFIHQTFSMSIAENISTIIFTYHGIVDVVVAKITVAYRFAGFAVRPAYPVAIAINVGTIINTFHIIRRVVAIADFTGAHRRIGIID